MPDYPRSLSEKSKRSHTFESALLAEFAGAAAGLGLVLLAITLVTQLVGLLGQAAGGAFAGEAVLAFLGFRTLNFLPVLLSIALFMSVLLALIRSYRESEMVVWFSSGMSLAAWVRPVLIFAVPLTVTIALVSLLLSPWAHRRSLDYQRQLESRDDVSQVTPGVFLESKQADRVFFVESVSEDQKRVGNVFVQSSQQQRLGVMVAREGLQGVDDAGDRYVELLNGTRYEGQPGSPEYRVMQFERYWMRVAGGEAKAKEPPPTSLSTLELMAAPSTLNLAELQWRIGLPVSALILALLAIPLSFVNPRGGRSLNLIMAILVYMSYSNLLSVVRLWVALGKVSAVAGFAGVHGLMLVLLAILYYRRLSPGAFARIWR
ncbi:MAG TPA: LPS export ABC transporter permease LptF [Burkholderiales bacterium]|nr:LPS export ABC transporter permease LptF [Burkholderiales bacterium]